MKTCSLVSTLVVALFCCQAALAHEIQYSTILNGPNEAPANASPGTGTALVTIDLDLATMRVQSSFEGLTGNVTAAHIHCCTTQPLTATVGVATPTPTFPGFPSGVSAGTYDATFDLTNSASYNAAFVTANGGTVSGAMNALLAGFESGRAYLNIHTNEFPGGEIRGFLVPEPTSGLLACCGAGLLGVLRRRR